MGFNIFLIFVFFAACPKADCPRLLSSITAILTVSIFGQLKARAW